ncbi:MAG TPA: NAD(P)-dependent oxidoreductase [Tenuifilaceae bacterium]|nr:NAD(P)-dependent oxidoreductase [Tenuifilaceae bacterium]
MNIIFAEPIGISSDKMISFANEMEGIGHSVKYFGTPVTDQSDLINRAKDADILVLSNQPLAATTINNFEMLKMISVAFTGVDHLPLDYCRERKITVCNAAGYSTHAVAELTISMAISLIRKTVLLDSNTRLGKTREGFLGGELYGKTFGIVGLGAIGTRVAQFANAFGCNVVAYNRTQRFIDGVKPVGLDELFSTADIVSLHIPATSQTVGMVSHKLISSMKPSSILINTARGSLVDYSALSKALNDGLIAGAAIDVYEHEPPIESEHPLFKSPNTILLPHIGYATKEAIDRRTDIVLENIRSWLKNIPQNVIV